MERKQVDRLLVPPRAKIVPAFVSFPSAKHDAHRRCIESYIAKDECHYGLKSPTNAQGGFDCGFYARRVWAALFVPLDGRSDAWRPAIAPSTVDSRNDATPWRCIRYQEAG